MQRRTSSYLVSREVGARAHCLGEGGGEIPDAPGCESECWVAEASSSLTPSFVLRSVLDVLRLNLVEDNRWLYSLDGGVPVSTWGGKQLTEHTPFRPDEQEGAFHF